MKVAIADPPYPGNSKRLYADHHDFAGEVDHKGLVDRLEDEFPDGWALCTGAKNLQEVAALCPPVKLRIWVKPGTPFGDKFIWSYEPVLIRGCRRPEVYVRDIVYAVPQGFLMTFRERPDEHVTGAKPEAFCNWLFHAMGLRLDDEVVDLFPGSGAIAHHWARWEGQTKLSAADHNSNRALVEELTRLEEKAARLIEGAAAEAALTLFAPDGEKGEARG
jgi:hypothetical protein